MRRGATVIETIIVLAIVAIVTRFALHAGLQWWYGEQAAEIVETIREVESAAQRAASSQQSDALKGAAVGTVPTGLADFLPGGITFQTQDYAIGWSHWSLGETLNAVIQGETLGTVTVRISDPALQNAFLQRAYPSLWYRTEDAFTFLVPGV